MGWRPSTRAARCDSCSRPERTFNPWSRSAPNDYSDPVFATPAVGDVTGTGQPDIVFGSYDHNIYTLQPDGHLVPGFPVQRADSIWSSPTLVDTSQTGRDDIIMGGDASGFDHCRGGWIVDYRYVGAGPKLMWQRCTAQTIWSSPTVGILNNTGRPAVVVGTSFYSGYKSATTNEIIAVYADNGENVPGWPVTAQRAYLRLTGHRADRRPTGGRLDILRPVHQRPRHRERLERLRPPDLVRDLRSSQRGHVVSGAR